MIKKLIYGTTLAVALAALALGMAITAQGQGRKSGPPVSNSLRETGKTQEPLYGEYKGVRIGMTADEARVKLGRAELKTDDQDYYVFSENEMVQIAYKAGKVSCISIDYMGGTGAPDYRNVVGPDIEIRSDGSMYKLVRYPQLGFWVSYNRTGKDSVVIVTVTIQKIG